MSSQEHEANLARIIENQRRSRAKRKEYVQELERRLRTYELQGVEATAEVQVAARRVAEENKKLRELLREHGYSDDYIMHYLKTSTQHQDSLVSQGSASGIQALEQTMVTRRPTIIDPNSPFTLPSQMIATSTSPPDMPPSASWDSMPPEASPAYTTPAVGPSTMETSPAQLYSALLIGGHPHPHAAAYNSHDQNIEGFPSPHQQTHVVPTSQPSVRYANPGYSQQQYHNTHQYR